MGFKITDTLIQLGVRADDPTENPPAGHCYVYIVSNVGYIMDDTGTVVSFGESIANNSLALAKLVNATAQYLLIGRSSAGSGAWQEITASANVFSILQAANYAAIRALLDLEIGTDVPAYDAQLSSLIRQNSQSAAYTTVLSDGGKHIYHPSSDNNARTFTIDSNANVAYPIGTAITFVNEINTVTIAITSDTLTLQGTGTTGSRTLAANGIATALKVASTKWVISGIGLT